MKKRVITGILLLGLVLISAIACGGDEEASTQSPAQAITGGTNVTITADGNIEASYHEKLTFGSGGKVEKLYVKDGDKVSHGDILAKLDTGALELAEAQAQVTMAQAQVGVTQAQIDMTQAELARQTAVLNLKYTRDTEATRELALLNAEISMEQAERALATGIAAVDFNAAKAQLDRAKNWYKYVVEIWPRNSAANGDDWQEALKRAEEQVDVAQAQYDNLLSGYDTAEIAIKKKQVAAAEKSLAQAQQNLDNLGNDLIIKELEVVSANKSVEHAQQNVDLAEQNVILAQKSFNQAWKELEGAAILAPFDGIVAKTGVKEGEYLSAAAFTGTSIVEIVDLRHMELTARVDEADIIWVKTGQRVIISVDALPETNFEGRVTFISPIARELGAVLFEDEDEAKDYEVKIDFGNTENSSIRAGMSATAEFIIE